MADDIPVKVTRRGKKSEDAAVIPSNLTAQEKLKIALAAVKDKGAAISGLASELDLDYGRKPTGFPALDIVLDGGWPKGKFSLIAGPEQTCKSTLALCTVANNQRIDPNELWVWVDAENSFDRTWARKCGVNLDTLGYIGPGILENVMQGIIDMIQTGMIAGIVVDSLAGLVPQAEVKKDKKDKGITRTMQDDSVAALAKKAGQFYRIANPIVAEHKPAVIMIGHVYTPIGDDYKEFEVKGGNPVKFWTHLRVISRRRKGAQERKVTIKMPSGQEKDVFAGYEAVFVVDKTRQGAHVGHEVSIPFIYGEGLSNRRSVIDMAFAYGVIQSAGAWNSHPALPEGKMQGRENVENFLLNNDEGFSRILEEVGIVLAKESTNGN
jgi:recombination protein RecA